jgi:glycosyltransferase 2 family protein
MHARRSERTPGRPLAWARAVAPLVVLAAVSAFLAWRLGTGPFLEGVRSVDGAALGAAAAIGALTTLCCAWRWRAVARGLGIELGLGAAVAAYYRSLFLNVTVPGGVVGDVHRGISHGREADDVGRALRAVAWERFAGQVAQIALTVVVLLALPSPVRGAMPLVVAGIAVAALAVLAVARLRPAGASASAFARLRRTVAADVRGGLLAPGARLGIALTSALVVAGHALTFLIAARAAGTPAPVSQLLPIALLAMAAMTLPNFGGWGPREGVTAWAFAAAGLGAGRGVTTSVVYGVLAIVAALPGAAVLLAAWFRSRRFGADAKRPARGRTAHPDRRPLGEGAAHA